MGSEIKKQEQPDWHGRGYSFFSNTNCEYFPCHPVPEGAEFNCLFCYCPLYILGKNCGGNFTYLDNGYKDCSQCLLPHQRENYGYIIQHYRQILAVMAEREASQ